MAILIPAGFGETEYIEKKSRFIGRVWQVSTEAEAAQILERIRKQHADASHNVYAYALRSGAARSSDDGEPSGTGGRPIMEVFLREGVSDFLCIVTRYFGGILLGAGGLTRAYAHAASIALDAAGVAELKRVLTFETRVGYALIDRMKLEIEAAGGVVSDIEYTDAALFRYHLPEEAVERFAARIREETRGEIIPSPAGERMLPVPAVRPSRGS